jgi:competence protein ComEA
MKKNLWLLAFGTVFGLLGAGLIMLISRQPGGQPVTLLPPPTPLPILVDVAGAVTHPGVYSLPPDSRVQDALKAAGGALPEASTGFLNQAAPLQDGDRIFLPTRIPTAPDTTSNSTPATRSQIVPPAAAGRININTATLAELDTLPGIGPITAQSIIAYREAHGPFNTIEDIMDVPGIGTATFERIKDLISIQDES